MTVVLAEHDVTLHCGDVRDILAHLPSESVNCCVTSPPYYGLRDYGVDGQIGLEPSPAEYVETLRQVFAAVRRVLRPDGTLWLNLGDSYSGSTSMTGTKSMRQRLNGSHLRNDVISRGDHGIPPKNLLGMPWRVAFALQDDGWTLRNDVIWHKCLSGGAWLWARTAKGDMPVMVKDLVRLDPTTVRLWNGRVWTRVLGWTRSDVTDERIEVVLRSGERIGCTGDHRWPTGRGNIEARNLRVGDVIETCTLPEPADAESPGYLTDDVAWLIGLYLAEGSRSGDVVQLSLHADEAEWLPRIRAAVRDLGGTMTHGVVGNSLAVRANGRVLRAAIDTFVGGTGARDKHLRNGAWQLPNTALRAIVRGYLNGDGHYDVKNDRWRLGFARNYDLERDLRTAAARLGATLTLHPRTATDGTGKRHPIFRGEWRWIRSGHGNEKDRGQIVALRRSRARQFWDIAVADDPHLFALASGLLTHNSNAMPESVTDRLSTRYEHVFLFTRSRRYWFNLDPIREERSAATLDRYRYAFKANSNPASHTNHLADGSMMTNANEMGRNPGDVWTIATQPYPEAHFATFPPELARRCIAAGCPPDGTVLDPFAGSGTTLMVARNLLRNSIGIELNPEYCDLTVDRIGQPVFEVQPAVPTAAEVVELPEPSPSLWAEL